MKTKYMHYHFIPGPDPQVQERQPSGPTVPNVYLFLHDDISTTRQTL